MGMEGGPGMIDDDRREQLEMERDRTERIRDYVPAEDFSLETAQMIARVEVSTGSFFRGTTTTERTA